MTADYAAFGAMAAGSLEAFLNLVSAAESSGIDVGRAVLLTYTHQLGPEPLFPADPAPAAPRPVVGVNGVLPGPTLDEGLSWLLAVEARAEARDHSWRQP